MAWTETELDALRRAYAAGTTRVAYDGKSVDYGSAGDLLTRIRLIEREMAGAIDGPEAALAEQCLDGVAAIEGAADERVGVEVDPGA